MIEVQFLFACTSITVKTYCMLCTCYASYKGMQLARHVQERGEGLNATVEEQLCFEIKTILLAGHETSAAMLTWTLLELTRNPDCLHKVNFTLCYSWLG